MIVAGIQFPDECPPTCPGHDAHPGQGGFCHRCPLFSCSLVEDGEGGFFRLIEPEGYREDWARAWKTWFDGEMEGYPDLRLFPPV